MKERLLALAVGLATLAVVVLGWKLYVEHFDVSKFVLPPPEDVAQAFGELVTDDRTWEGARITTIEIVAGFLLASVVGVVVGTLLAEVPLLDRALTPYVIALQVLPKVAIIPLLIVWFGFGLSSKIVIAATFACFPILVGTRAGIRAVDPGHHDLLAVLRARRWQRVGFVHLPAALPSILTGMEVGIVLATIGTIVAEYLTANEGLGYLAYQYYNLLQVDTLFAAVALLSLLGFLLHGAVRLLRRLVVPWHASVDVGASTL